MPDLLTFEELTRRGRVFAGLGVRKLRLTGGEPLLRRDLERLVTMLAGIDGVGDIALTTNGGAARRQALAARGRGLRRVTVSLDSLDDAVFMALNDAAFPVAGVLNAIAAAASAGLPVKVNMVVKRGCSDQSVLPMAEHFRGSGHVLRFIEFMDVGMASGWRLNDVVAAADIIALIGERWPLQPLAPGYPGEVACRYRYRYRDGGGEIGVIASVTQPFCRGCTPGPAVGRGIAVHLFAAAGHDLRGPLRGGGSDEALRGQVTSVWTQRADRYSAALAGNTPEAESWDVAHLRLGSHRG